jgi:antitoxin (DNA-binding transcriptional repressor) of toxin-antitoxin stability system
MVQMALKDAQLQLPDLVAAAVRGDEVIIILEDQHGVRLVPIEPIRPGPRFGSARGKILYMADDFDAPLEEFKEYMG